MQIDDKTIARFMSKVDTSGDCHIWTAYKHHGYGRFNIGGTIYHAHQVAYWIAKGEIPEGLEPDHLCRNRACVNPDHLEAVTHRENSIRGGAGDNNRQKTHCPKGHPYSGDNLRAGIRQDGRKYRECRICSKDRVQRLNQQRKEHIMATTSYSYTVSEWKQIIKDLRPDRYQSHKTLISFVSNAVAQAEQRGRETVTLYPFAEYFSLRPLIERRVAQLGL